MTWEDHYAVNLAAYSLLKEQIEAAYPRGRFVAIAGGRIVADDANLEALFDRLKGMGLNPRESLVEQVGRVVPPADAFPGMLTMTAFGRNAWNTGTDTGAR